MPYESGTGCTYDSGNFPLLLEKLLEDSDYEGLKRWRDEINSTPNNDLVAGIGLCVQVEDTGALGKESAKVVITKDCKIQVWTGRSPHGQGLETTLAQARFIRVRHPAGESDCVLWRHQRATMGYRHVRQQTLSISGSAVVDACRKVKTALVAKASESWEFQLRNLRLKAAIWSGVQ